MSRTKRAFTLILFFLGLYLLYQFLLFLQFLVGAITPYLSFLPVIALILAIGAAAALFVSAEEKSPELVIFCILLIVAALSFGWVLNDYFGIQFVIEHYLQRI